MSNPQASFVGARSQTLAALWLTQHRDLRVLDQKVISWASTFWLPLRRVVALPAGNSG
ncbi:MAG TPA: hypothetical protein VGB15_16645 [Longimicrobium sp.]